MSKTTQQGGGDADKLRTSPWSLDVVRFYKYPMREKQVTAFGVYLVIILACLTG